MVRILKFCILKSLDHNAGANIPKERRNKLQITSQHCTLVGYNETSKAYNLYDHSTNKVIELIHVFFDEVLSHGLLGPCFTLIAKYSSPIILVDLSFLCFDDDSPLLTYVSSTTSTLA
jgi:hypothetical protein